ncbi:MAG: choice-of-anchor A family protein [Wenzhouxiangellaceae bacterium]
MLNICRLSAHLLRASVIPGCFVSCFLGLSLICGAVVAQSESGSASSLPLPIAVELGEARRANGFFLEFFHAESSDVEGRLAAGGDVAINHYSIADQLQATVRGASLVVGGDLDFPSGRVFRGDIMVAGSADGVGDPVLNGLADDQALIRNAELPFDFQRQFEVLQRTSQLLAVLPANGTYEYQWGGLHLTGDCVSPAQVFELNGTQVLAAHTFEVSCIPDGATVIFNIDGAHAGLTNMSLESLTAYRSNALFNFFQATSLELAGIGVQGSILAPWAAIEQPQGVVHGSVMARSWNGMMQLNHRAISPG